DAARRAAGQIAIESVAVQHAAAVFVDQLLDGDAGRRQMHARLLHATGDGEGTQAFATVATVPGKPLGPLLLDLAYPEKGLHVVLERRAAEQADFRHIRRTQTRLAALAFDRLDHRGFFTANVSTRAATQLDGRQREIGFLREERQLALQHLAAAVIFVAQVDIDFGDADGPCGDQHAFQETMRIALEVVAILERAGFALVDVHRHQARLGLRTDDAPFAPRGEARATQATQARVLHFDDHLFAVDTTFEAVLDEFVAAVLAVLVESDVSRSHHFRIGVVARPVLDGLGLDQLFDFFGRCVRDRVLTDDDDRRGFAAAHTGRMQHTHVLAQNFRQLGEQFVGARHLTGQRIADAHGDGRRRLLV